MAKNFQDFIKSQFKEQEKHLLKEIEDTIEYSISAAIDYLDPSILERIYRNKLIESGNADLIVSETFMNELISKIKLLEHKIDENDFLKDVLKKSTFIDFPIKSEKTKDFYDYIENKLEKLWAQLWNWVEVLNKYKEDLEEIGFTENPLVLEYYKFFEITSTPTEEKVKETFIRKIINIINSPKFSDTVYSTDFGLGEEFLSFTNGREVIDFKLQDSILEEFLTEKY